jgi:hypothetical protein
MTLATASYDHHARENNLAYPPAACQHGAAFRTTKTAPNQNPQIKPKSKGKGNLKEGIGSVLIQSSFIRKQEAKKETEKEKQNQEQELKPKSRLGIILRSKVRRSGKHNPSNPARVTKRPEMGKVNAQSHEQEQAGVRRRACARRPLIRIILIKYTLLNRMEIEI